METATGNKRETMAPARDPFVPRPVGEYWERYVDGLGDGTRELIGIASGYPELDRMTRGLRGVTVLAGTPGAGKTALACEIAWANTMTGDGNDARPTVFYSLEMDRDEILTRMISGAAGFPLNDMTLWGRRILAPETCGALEREKQWDADELTRLRAAVGQVQTASKRNGGWLYVFDGAEQGREDGTLHVGHIREEISLIAQVEKRAPLIIVDHLQTLPPEGADGARWDTLRTIDETLKQLSGIAKTEYTVTGADGITRRERPTILLLCEINREHGGRPTRKALRGSGQIEHTADIILAMQSEMDLYADNSDWGAQEHNQGRFDLWLLKARKGRSGGFLPMRLDGKTQQITVDEKRPGYAQKETQTLEVALGYGKKRGRD